MTLSSPMSQWLLLARRCSRDWCGRAARKAAQPMDRLDVTTAMWLSNDRVQYPNLPTGAARPVVVAVPARNESEHIEACLQALDCAARRYGGTVVVIIGANNCSDDTAAVARRFRPRAMTIIIEEIVLSKGVAHAGGARRQVMDRAAALAGTGGIIMTTDADSRVDVDWIAANAGEIAAGADAVAGMITFDASARSTLPDLAARTAEWQLAALHARLEHLVDPRPHDPWPRHIWAWGASLALTVEAYRAVGGLPPVPLAEDRALADAIERAGLRLRRSHAPLVFTSARRIGRALGGFADMLDRYARGSAVPCDAALEPTKVLLRRLRLRARLRAVNSIEAFGDRWDALQSATPGLARRRVNPVDLAKEVAWASRAMVLLERHAARRGDNPPVALAA